MKTIIFSTVALCLTCLYAAAQDSLRYEIVETKIIEDDLPEGWRELIDNNGYVAGRFTGKEEKKGRAIQVKYIVKPKNKRKVTIDALDDLTIVPTAERIITSGEIFGAESEQNTFLKIYDLKGKLITSTQRLCGWPYCIAVADNGDIALAGPKTDKEKGTRSILYKFDKDGNKLWEEHFIQDVPHNLFISNDGKYTVVFVCNNKELPNGTEIYFNENGKILHQENRFALMSLHFFDNNKVLSCDGNYWKLQDISHDFKALINGTNLMPPVSKYSLNIHPNKTLFSIINLKKENGNKSIVVTTYNINNGEIITSYNLDIKPCIYNHKFIEFSGNDIVYKYKKNYVKLQLK